VRRCAEALQHLCELASGRREGARRGGLEDQLQIQHARVEGAEAVLGGDRICRHPRLTSPRGDLKRGACLQRSLRQAPLRDDDRPRDAVEDASCPPWRGGRGVSAAALQAPTFADALKLATFGRARVLSVAIKDRGALFVAGQSADLALFYDVERGELTSTKCYAPGPPDWLVVLQRAHPVSEWKDWVWTLSRPEASYARLAEDRTEIRDLYGIGCAGPATCYAVGDNGTILALQ